VEIDIPGHYEQLEKEKGLIIADENKRRDLIRNQAEKLAAELNGKPHLPEELLEELTFINEYPTGFVGILKIGSCSFLKRYWKLL